MMKNAIEKEELVAKVLERIGKLGFDVSPEQRLGDSVYRLDESCLIYTDFTHLNYRKEYIFSLSKNTLDYIFDTHRNSFLLLICDSTERVFILPISLITEIFHDIYGNGSDFKVFKPVIKLKNGVWFLRFIGQYDITDYLNRYDFLIAESKPTRQITRYNSIIEIQSIEEKYKSLAAESAMRYDSLHSTTVDMLKRIGEWAGFEVVTESRPLSIPDFPYEIDCLWYKNGDLFMAIEVCYHGVVEKDKDSLKLAKQHGARKVVIVSEINKMERIRKLFMLDSDIKPWTEIWSFERVFNLFENGMKFYKDFEKFKRYGWTDSMSEFI
jgi:hypothetical protein